jgi:hypothetical protein
MYAVSQSAIIVFITLQNQSAPSQMTIMYACMYSCIHACRHVWMYVVCMCVYVRVYTYICAYMYVGMHEFVPVHTLNIHIHTCINTCIHAYTQADAPPPPDHSLFQDVHRDTQSTPDRNLVQKALQQTAHMSLDWREREHHANRIRDANAQTQDAWGMYGARALMPGADADLSRYLFVHVCIYVCMYVCMLGACIVRVL